ncbi:hypothetical protein [Solimonas sp. SE-A11]|uniref:hypothetical protein n=1 Tax=Solimonas sp. SE-A11 TaxID=3054954 RepID=UPI00259D2AF5|nr:hypothetical protein [Solimonas sp. SE-A11]MDM4771820.1 hypothetical protein [Solimonas sp. SE-A11]
MNMKTRWPFAATLIAGLLLAACTDQDDGGPDGRPPSPGPGKIIAAPLGKAVPCRLTLTPARAEPGEVVQVNGIPASFVRPGMRVIARDGSSEAIGAAFFEAPASGQPSRFTVPPRPAKPLEGGPVLIEIGDGRQRCEAVSLEIGALPDAEPALVGRVADKLEEWLELQVRLLGGDPATLLTADRSAIDPSLLPFALNLRLLGSEAQPGWLRRQVTQAVASGDRVIPGVMAAADLEGELDRAIAELRELPLPTLAAAVLAKNALCQGEQLTPNPPPIGSAAELSRRMLAAGKGGLYQSNALGQLLGTVGIAASEEASNGANAFGAGNVSLGANALGAKLYILKTTEAARQALEPRTIESFDVRRADTLLVEDRPANQPGRWENASVIAVGTEFNINAAALEGLITTVGMIPGPVGAAVGVGSTAFANPLSNIQSELTEDGCTRIKAPRYGPINVSDEDWTRSEIIGDAVTRIDHRTYRGAAIGGAELKITLRGEKFGVLSVGISRTFAIAVNPQMLSLLPSSVRLSAPGQTASIGATIANSEAGPNGPVNIARRILTLGDHQISNTRISGDLLEADVQTSAKREDFPLRIEFKPLNPVLPGGPPRERIAVIDIGGELTLKRQGSACLLPGSEVEFQANLAGFAANELGVDLQLSGGTLVSHANNQAAQRIVVRAGEAGTLSLRATSRADRNASDEISLPVLRSCLRKVHYSGTSFDAGGIGTESDGSESCPPFSTVELQSTRIGVDPEEIVLPPAIPPDGKLWFERSERITADFLTDFTLRQGDGEGNCPSARLSGSSKGEGLTYAREDGTLGLRLNADISGSCVSQGDISGCSGNQATGVMNTLSYFEVTEDTPVRIEGELRCANLSGLVLMTAFSGIASRYENGVTPYIPTDPIEGSLIRKPDGSGRVPVLWVAECKSANQVIPFSETVIFQAPRRVGGKDLIIVSTSGSAQVLASGKPAMVPISDPSQIPFPAPGNYRSTADVEFRVKLLPQ